MKCSNCDDCLWVCEAHPDRPFRGALSPRACKCGAHGRRCLVCAVPRLNDDDRSALRGIAPKPVLMPSGRDKGKAAEGTNVVIRTRALRRMRIRPDHFTARSRRVAVCCAAPRRSLRHQLTARVTICRKRQTTCGLSRHADKD
jgi:hypothetical protein